MKEKISIRTLSIAMMQTMLRAVHASNFRMLAQNYLHLPSQFNVLVGQNATGKSTFLSAIDLVAQLLRHGAKQSLFRLSPTFLDLCFDPGQPAIAVALEFDLAATTVSSEPSEPTSSLLRYEVELGPIETGRPSLGVRRENLFRLTKSSEGLPSSSGPAAASYPVIHDPHHPPRHWETLVAKTGDGRAHFYGNTGLSETWRPRPDASAFSVLPAEEESDEHWLARRAQEYLTQAPQILSLDVAKLRRPTPPNLETRLQLDGGNLPLAARRLKEQDPVLFDMWVRHLAMAVKGLEVLDVVERAEDRHLYLAARFAGQHHQPVPSWLLSDGTLRLMALTLLGFAGDPLAPQLWLIEQPEDGLHPLAMECVHSALRDPQPGNHIMLTTHSPVFLAQVDIEQILVFRRANEGYSVICQGVELPELQDWHGRRDMAHLFASGVLS